MMRAQWMAGLAALAIGLLGATGASSAEATSRGRVPAGAPVRKIQRTEADWKKRLTPQQYRVLRESGTDVAFTGALVHVKGKGRFVCAGCGLELFSTEHKFESGTGWPSFWAPVARSHVAEIPDTSDLMVRTEVECARCGGHLGHVFDDGPAPTGLRYCVNSSSMQFVPAR